MWKNTFNSFSPDFKNTMLSLEQPEFDYVSFEELHFKNTMLSLEH